MLSHANLLSSAQGFIAAEDIRATDELLCYLPMAWIGNSLFSLVLTLLVGFTCNCPERPQTVQRDLRELGPTIAIAPPRIWENMLTQLRVRAADSTPLKRRLFEFFRGLAERAEQRKAGRQANLADLPAGPCARRGAGLRAGARPAGLAAGALGLYRRRATRSRYLPVLSRVRGQHQAGLGLDRARRSRLVAARWRGGPGHGRPGHTGFRRADCRGRRGADPLRRGVQGILQAARRHPRDDDRGRVAAQRRFRLCRPPRPSRHRRPRQGCRQTRRRHAFRAAIRREQAQIQPVHRARRWLLAIAGRLSRRSSQSI